MSVDDPVEYQEAHTLNGIGFDVRVLRAEGSLRGEWNCSACGSRGANTRAHPDTQSAVEEAKANFVGHMTTTHLKRLN
ncbi:MAG TPA: hypothetical protein VGR31_13120 [Planctomycetota bacterium]|jgi:hypothetical protein|nr:hypothetical protein [Planctomycetota bacterium]